MSKNYRRFIVLGTIAAIAAPTLSVISCGTSNEVSSKNWGDTNFARNYDLTNYASQANDVKFIAPMNKSKESKSNSMYQMMVYSFADGNNDGIGDFIGAKEKLGYIKKLGFDQIWLSPLHPASSYHGYDVIDYEDVAPELGGMEAFDAFLEEAHKQGIKIYMDMVFNHTSAEHPWFQKALAGDSKYRNYYHFEDNGEDYGDTNTIGHDLGDRFTNVASPVLSSTPYISKFWAGMPDLNLDNPDVIDELDNVTRFWSKKGVDGYRYDAFMEFFSSKGETKNNFNEAKIFADLREAALKGISERTSDKTDNPFMMGEWWGSAVDASKYYVDDSGRKALDSGYDAEHWKHKNQTEINVNEIDQILGADSSKSGSAQWTPFLDNHDEQRWLTDYMRYVETMVPGKYDITKPLPDDIVQLAKYSLFALLSLPADPIVFQGDELGYHGSKDNGDAAFREPLRWSDRNDIDFYEIRSGEKDTHIKINNSKDRGYADKQIEDKNSIASLTTKMNDLRSKYNFMGSNDVSTISSPSAYISNDGNDAFVRKSKDGSNKILFVYSQTGNSYTLKQNIESKDFLVSAPGVKIEGAKLTLPRSGYVAIKLA